LGLFKVTAVTFFTASALLCAEPSALPYRVLSAAKSGGASRAVALYLDSYAETKRHDMSLLRELGLLIIAEGAASHNPETELLALFGAGVSSNEEALEILERGLASPIPQMQLVALHFLSRFQNDRANRAIQEAFRSNFLPIRLEAAYLLSEKKDPGASGQAEALMYKVDEELLPLFPPLFAEAGDQKALRHLKKLLNHPDSRVRVSAVQSSARAGRDDLLPQIRRLATQHGMAHREAAAWALGVLKDESAVPLLQRLAKEKPDQVRLAALVALDRLGNAEGRGALIEAAERGSLFAVNALGEVDGTEETLYKMVKSGTTELRLNAALALLEKRDPHSLPAIAEILVRDERGLAFVLKNSQGGALANWQVVPSAHHNLKESPLLLELSLAMREQTLIKAAELPERDFLALARHLFNHRQNDLVPLLVRLLENVRSEEALVLLREGSEKAGAPLIRSYCNLALYRLKEEGPYYENLKRWIEREHGTELIRFRPIVPRQFDNYRSRYSLTPEETSRLLIEAFESFARMQDDKGIEVLLHAIRHGNPNNKYALAGLLIFATL